MANTDLAPSSGFQGDSYIYKLGTTPNTRTVVSQKVRILAPAYSGGDLLYQIGVLSNFAPTESRTIENVRGIGFGDIVAELVPGNTEPMTASCERTMLYLANLWQASGFASGVSGPVRSLRHHRWPFDIKQQVAFSVVSDADYSGSWDTGGTISGSGFDGGVQTQTYPAVTKDIASGDNTGGNPANGVGSHTVLITYYEGCWWSDWNTTFQRDTAVVMENGTITITDVHDGASVYGEFLATGNDPSIGQFTSARFGGTSGMVASEANALP